MKKFSLIISSLFFFGIFQNRLIAQIAKADTIAWGESISVLLGNKIGYRGLLMSQNKEITALQLENGERVQFRTESIVRQRILKAKITNVRAFAGNPSTEKPRIFGGDLSKIVMLDGSKYIGLIRKKDTAQIVFETQSVGIINIPVSEIKNIQLDYDVEDDEIATPNISHSSGATRYFIAPSALNLKKGEGYYQNVILLGNVVNYGLTNNISVGGGVVLYPLLGNDNFDPRSTEYWLNSKISFPIIENLTIAGGIGTSYRPKIEYLENKSYFLATAFGVITVGDRKNNLSIGAARRFKTGEAPRNYLLGVAAMLSTDSGEWAFVTENSFYYSPRKNTDGYGQISIGARHTGRRGGTFDFGIFTNPTFLFASSPYFIPLFLYLPISPYFGFTIPLGRAKK